jgi:glycosyltransferase involved in cell wall biosynthesis
LNDVAIDITRLLGRYLKKRLPTGVDRVSLEYIRYFSPRAYAIVRVLGRTLIFNIKDSQDLFQTLLKSDFARRKSTILQILKAFLSLKSTIDLNEKILFNTGHSGLEKPAYPAHLAKLGVKPIFFVHDLIPITHPEYCRAGEKEKHVTRMKAVLQLAKGIIANSQYTLDSLNEFGRQQKALVRNSTVALLAAAELSPSSESRPIADPYFVILGTIEPRKNHAMLLRVWRKLIEQKAKVIPKLVIIGQRGWDIENIIALLEHDQVLRPHVTELASCTDAMLVNYLQHAQALLFPSFVEGFGMPLVEALSIGVPAIASDIAAFHEVAGNIPEYLDPNDEQSWAEIILQYSDEKSTLRNSQVQRIQHFEAASWPQHFEKVEALLKQVS